ncbi:MAG: exo-alpha-sialidase [Burkholderiales bacterium]|nr:exo-alpha-sialidase [Burkholderiales bacterium]
MIRTSRWLAALALAWALPALAQHMHPQQPDGAASAPAAKRRPAPLAMGATFSPDGELWVAALDAQQRLTLKTSADDGRHWSALRVLDTGTDKIAADGENRPKLAFGPNGGTAGWVVISYTEPLAKPYTGRIRMLRSDDGGRSFSAPFTVHQDPQVITHRFESIAVDAKGTLHTLWIDKRDLELQIQAAGPAPEPAPGAKRTKPKVDYRGAAIYRNESTDGGKTFGPDLKLADHSCECCRIALASAPDGSLVALWRHVFAPNERDHAFAPVKAGGPEPVRATLDHWAIDACPHHGPGLAPAAAGGYHAVWFGIRAGDARVRYGQLGADGSPRGDAQPLPDERAEHAAIASAGRQVVIAWRSFDGRATRWRAWLSGDDGQHFTLKELGRSVDENDHPLLLRRGEQIFALWRTAQEIHVERLTP